MTTRIKKPDEDDLKKSQRLMRYLRNASHMLLTLEADGTNIIKWWVDAS
jgi:hypothetical protein